MPTDLPLQLQRHNNGWARRPCKQEQAALLRRMLFASLVRPSGVARAKCTLFTSPALPAKHAGSALLQRSLPPHFPPFWSGHG